MDQHLKRVRDSFDRLKQIDRSGVQSPVPRKMSKTNANPSIITDSEPVPYHYADIRPNCEIDLSINGPWLQDMKDYPANAYVFYSNGFECHVRRHPYSKAWNGYVEVPIGFSLDLDNINVHGGITGGCIGTDGRSCIGFDTMHAGDMWYSKYDWNKGGHYWTRDEVIAETRKLAAHLLQMYSQTLNPPK